MEEDLELTLVRKLLAKKYYQVERKISEGAYGQVYEVIHTGQHERRAIKMIELSQVSKLGKIHEVNTEISLLKRLKHPGVIGVVEVLRWANYVGLVMELGGFGDLFSFIGVLHSRTQLRSRLPQLMACYLGQALQVIDYLHAQGVVHRDIKPENFVIGEDLRLRMVDFATALIAPQSPLFSIEQILILQPPKGSLHSGLVGSANYLSPEGLQLRYSTKSDIWAFGIMAYKFYFNCLPFEGNSNAEIFQQLAEGEIDLSKAAPQVQELIVLSLKRDPNQRATAKLLKLCSLFKGIQLGQVFRIEPPLSRQELQVGGGLDFLFELFVEKKMFFGNFKARYLTIRKAGKALLMAYRYLPSKLVKREFQMTLNDYAQSVSGRLFEVVARNKRLMFRVAQGQSAEHVASQVNAVIKKNYYLE